MDFLLAWMLVACPLPDDFPLVETAAVVWHELERINTAEELVDPFDEPTERTISSMREMWAVCGACPKLGEASRFPSPKFAAMLCRDLLRFEADCLLLAVLDYGRREEWESYAAEAQQLHKIWNAVYYLDAYYPTTRRQNLWLLREMLPAKEWETGAISRFLPPCHFAFVQSPGWQVEALAGGGMP